MTLDEVIDKYIKLRDKKAVFKNEYEQKVAQIDDALAKIENKLLEIFQSTGMDSMKTGAGTAYVSLRTSATVGDREAFMKFVQDNNEWPLLEVKPSKTAVAEYRAANDDLPPGINWREERVVNVRRS